jgi:hypothetical protein
MYFQLLFALDRVKMLAPEHPEWKEQEPFASLLKGDVKSALAGGLRCRRLSRWLRLGSRRGGRAPSRWRGRRRIGAVP